MAALVTALRLPFFLLTWGPKRQSLAAALTEAGIPTLPKKEVRAHKAEMLAEALEGESQVMVRLVRAWIYLTAGISLLWLIDHISEWKKCSHDSATKVYLVTASLTLCAGIVCLAEGWSILGLVLLSPVVSLGLLFLTSVLDENLFMGYVGDSLLSYKHWEALPISNNELHNLPPLPKRLVDRRALLERLPGVTIEVEALDADPFLVATRGWGPFKRREYVGAWATGTEFDNI